VIDVAFLALVPHRKYELPGIIMSSFVAIKLDTFGFHKPLLDPKDSSYNLG
jgi:uncharacterized membrane protein